MTSEGIHQYCASIGLSNILMERVKVLHNQYARLIQEEPNDIFVSEYVQADGQRVFENLWFFSPHYAMEAHQFVTNDDLDVAPMSAVRYVRVQKTEYDFVEAKATSRLVLNSNFAAGVSATMKASSENCNHLRDVIRKYFVAKLRD
jgi:hypothetical protein